MENKEYLNEEQYKKTKKKLSAIGIVLLSVGAVLAISSIALQATNSDNAMLMGLLGVPGFLMISVGIFFLVTSHGREISAYMTQQQMPIAQENIEKMAPSVGKAAGTVSKEIAKGIKEEMDDKE